MKRCRPSEDVCLEHSRPLIGERFCEDGCKHRLSMMLNRHGGLASTARGDLYNRVCERCGAWLSLGPARDTGPHAASVATEVRAAEIAELWHDADPAEAFDFVRRLNDEETRGWSIAETSLQHHTDRWHAGYLARAICHHDTEEGE